LDLFNPVLGRVFVEIEDFKLDPGINTFASTWDKEDMRLFMNGKKLGFKELK